MLFKNIIPVRSLHNQEQIHKSIYFISGTVLNSGSLEKVKHCFALKDWIRCFSLWWDSIPDKSNTQEGSLFVLWFGELQLVMVRKTWLLGQLSAVVVGLSVCMHHMDTPPKKSFPSRSYHEPVHEPIGHFTFSPYDAQMPVNIEIKPCNTLMYTIMNVRKK